LTEDVIDTNKELEGQIRKAQKVHEKKKWKPIALHVVHRQTHYDSVLTEWSTCLFGERNRQWEYRREFAFLVKGELVFG